MTETTTLAERLVMARRRAKLTLRELAERAGVGAHSQIAAWEGGQAPSPDNLAKVVRALGVSGHWVLTGEGEVAPGKAAVNVKAARSIAASILEERAAQLREEAKAPPADDELGHLVEEAIRESEIDDEDGAGGTTPHRKSGGGR